MNPIVEHRANARFATSLDGVADYTPLVTSSRWWENFEVRMVDVGGGGFQISSPVPVKAGGRLRLVVGPKDDPAKAVSVEGEIVWVREPVVPWLGSYRAGASYRPALQSGIEELLELSGAERPAPSF